MNEKEKLLKLIVQKGVCYGAQVSCINCPCKVTCDSFLNSTKGSKIVSNGLTEWDNAIYTYCVNKYIEDYGEKNFRDDLVEASL